MELAGRIAQDPRRVFPNVGLPVALLAIGLIAALGWLALAKTLGQDTLASTADLRSQHALALTEVMSRSVQLGDNGDAQVFLASATFFQLTNRVAEGAKLGADRSLVFVANENSHINDLPPHFAPILRIDGVQLAVPTEERVLTDAVHHRTTAFIFGDIPASFLNSDHTLELLVPTSETDRVALLWRSPIGYPDEIAGGAGISLGLLLALGAGLLAAISPCLLQLTAFYLPTLAGVSAGEGAARPRLVPTAAIFIAGFTIPYTVGGALMGGFGAEIAKTGLLTPTGPIAEGAGVVMILVAVLVAFRARAPLICALPLPAAVRRDRRVGPLQTFVSGFAIATGCLACFGGAILGVLLVYTGLFGSALLGGAAMLVFSLGLAIPFLLAAFSFSRVAPLVESLQRHARAVGLVSATVMAFFGLTMATGNYHVVSGWLAQRLPLV